MMSSVEAMRRIATELAKQHRNGEPMKSSLAGAFAAQLEKWASNKEVAAALTEYDAPPTFTTQHKEYYVALYYAILVELEKISAGDRTAKQLRADTAKIWAKVLGKKCADSSVSKYLTKYRSQVEHRLKSLSNNVFAANMTREELLREELKQIAP
jgi:hypothetical protein